MLAAFSCDGSSGSGGRDQGAGPGIAGIAAGHPARHQDETGGGIPPLFPVSSGHCFRLFGQGPATGPKPPGQRAESGHSVELVIARTGHRSATSAALRPQRKQCSRAVDRQNGGL